MTGNFGIILEMKRIFQWAVVLSLSGGLLASCNNSYTGKIIFSLEGGEFLDKSFSTNYLVGQAGTAVTQEIPTPYKEGYFFVGWREKKKDGSYRVISKVLSDDGNSYYYYPYGTDTFYAYFEPLVTIDFDLGDWKDKATIIAPVSQKENFSGHTLNGYATKSIPSVDYLPTVDTTGLHTNFEYWYTLYPLTSKTNENSTTHYMLDTSKDEGIYRFDKGSFKDSMEFLLDTNITLYAYYQDDPTITLHYNMNGMDDYSFQGKDNIKKELKADMSEKFGFDYSSDAENYYYSTNEAEYRFEGFFLDSGFTQKFALDSTIYLKDIDLYLKWSRKIKITLDYGQGSVNGQNTEINSSYYAGDLLGEEFQKSHIPTKENGIFRYYTLNGKKFDFRSDRLPDDDITLVAVYDDDPILTLSMDYPTAYTGSTKISDLQTYLKPNSDLSSLLSYYQNMIQDESLTTKYFYTKDSNMNQIPFYGSKMPDEDLTLYLRIDYTPSLVVKTICMDESNAISKENDTEISCYFDSSSLTPSLSQTDIPSLTDNLTVDSDTYLYDGCFTSATLEEEVIFPLCLETSHIMMNSLTIYRKMAKSITLTFYNDGETTPLGTLKVLPGRNISKYQTEIKNLIGNYTELKLDGKILSTILPSVDSNVYVLR
jgi:hypothetical protein